MAVRRGLAYPLQIEAGGLKLSEDEQLYRESIRSILETRLWERVMLPLYGTPDYVFDAAQGAGVVAQQIQIALETQIPGPSFSVTGELSDEGDVSLNIDWAIDEVPRPTIQYLLRA